MINIFILDPLSLSLSLLFSLFLFLNLILGIFTLSVCMILVRSTPHRLAVI
jgi:hypothetical protein